MAKWFRDFPISLKNSTEKSRSKSTLSPKTPRNKGTEAEHPGRVRSSCAREESAPSRLWDTLIPGRHRRSSEERRTLKSATLATGVYLHRLIKVDKQDKKLPCSGGAGGTGGQEKGKGANRGDTLIIPEDYADPFDAQKTKQQRDAERPGENDGYMEPYDAQQMITEIRRRGSKDLLKTGSQLEGSEQVVVKGRPASLQIYDIPYEGEQDAQTPTEHKQPWERKKEQIVRALSVQFDSSERSSPTKEEPSQPTWQQHLRQKILRSSSSSPPSSPTEAEEGKVDPSLPLEKQSWYHGCVTRQEAEWQLQPCREASFLVRNSESGTSKYSIALKTSQGCVHIIVAQTKGNGYTLDQSSCIFPSIPEVVHHYCTQRLPFTGAEHMTLQHPVPRPH